CLDAHGCGLCEGVGTAQSGEECFHVSRHLNYLLREHCLQEPRKDCQHVRQFQQGQLRGECDVLEPLYVQKIHQLLHPLCPACLQILLVCLAQFPQQIRRQGRIEAEVAVIHVCAQTNANHCCGEAPYRLGIGTRHQPPHSAADPILKDGQWLE